jgi:hypothetical protein
LLFINEYVHSVFTVILFLNYYNSRLLAAIKTIMTYRISFAFSALAIALLFALFAINVHPAQADDNVSKINGTFSFAGEAGCLVSRGGFTPTLNPIPLASAPSITGIFQQSFSVEGTATFDGKGNGVRSGTSVSTSIAGAGNTGSSAEVIEFSVPFTYTVDADGTVHTQTSAPLTGTVVAGERTGQTVTVDQIPLDGHVSKDGKTLTLASKQAVIERLTFSNGDSFPRICHRARVFQEI